MRMIIQHVLRLTHTFSFRLTCAFFLIILLMGSATVGGVFALDQLLNQTRQLTRVQETREKLLEMKVILLERNFQISQTVLLNRYQALYDFVNKNDDKLHRALQDYKQNQQGETDKTFLTRLDQAEIELNQRIKQMSENLQTGAADEAVLILQNEFNTALNQFNNLLTDMVQRLDPVVSQQKQAAADTSSSSQSLLLVSAISAALVAASLAIALAIFMTRRIKILERAVTGLGRGDLEVRVARPSRDELGGVGAAFNQMAERLSELLVSVESKRKVGHAAGTQVGVIVSQLSSMAVNQSQVAAEQATMVAQLTTNLEELAVTVRHIAENASEVATGANVTLGSANYFKRLTVETSEAGQLSLERSSESTVIIHQVETQLNAARQVLTQLIKQSDSIENFVELIRNIADETHLIALNGAIEAAGAGEAGDRFGVIASAVRSLANRTKLATADVTQYVAEVRTSIKQLGSAVEQTAFSSQASVKLSQQADASVKQLSQFTQETEEQFDQIVRAMASVVGLADQIRVSTSQQDSASVQLTQTMRELNNTSQVVAASSQELAQTTYQLQNVSDDMLEKMAS